MGEINMDDIGGLKIDWTIKTYLFYTFITLTGFAIVIGWFHLATAWMKLVG
jgi:hypothetical protein